MRWNAGGSPEAFYGGWCTRTSGGASWGVAELGAPLRRIPRARASDEPLGWLPPVFVRPPPERLGHLTPAECYDTT